MGITRDFIDRDSLIGTQLDSFSTRARVLEATQRHLGGSTPHFVVRYFTTLRRGILLAILGEISSEVVVPSQDQPIYLNITAAMAAAFSDVGSMVFVVQPIGLSEEGRDEKAEEVRAELEAMLRNKVRRIEREELSRTLPPSGVHQLPVVDTIDQGGEAELLSKAYLREIRFGLKCGSGAQLERRYTAILAAMSGVLADDSVPITYLHFPHEWSVDWNHVARGDHLIDHLASGGEVECLHWMKVGYAVFDRGRELALDFDAIDVATRHRAAVAIFEPGIEGVDGDEQFGIGYMPDEFLVPNAGVCSAGAAGLASDGGPEGHQHDACIFVQGRARPGLMNGIVRGGLADMSMARLPIDLARNAIGDVQISRGLVPDEDLDYFPVRACSMGVLYGNTFASFALEASRGLVTAERLDSLKAPLGLESVELLEGPDGEGARGSDRSTTFWVAWRCRESRGVFHEVLSELTQLIAELHQAWNVQRVDGLGLLGNQGGGLPLGVEYAVSRVLKEGDSCAGKLRISCKRDMLEWHESRGSRPLETLEASLTAVLGPRLASWSPPDPEWLGRPVVVDAYEPTEAPWARLVAAADSEYG